MGEWNNRLHCRHPSPILEVGVGTVVFYRTWGKMRDESRQQSSDTTHYQINLENMSESTILRGITFYFNFCQKQKKKDKKISYTLCQNYGCNFNKGLME